MAITESIKGALQALENEAAWAVSMAQCLAAAGGEDEPVWVTQFGRTVAQLSQRIEDLAQAINAGDRGGTPQVKAVGPDVALVAGRGVSGRFSRPIGVEL